MPMAIPAVAAAFASAAAAVTAISATVVLGLTVGTWLTLGAVGSAVAMSMSAAAKAKKAARGLESPGSQLQLKAAGDTAPIPIAFGRSATGGYLTYRDTTGSKNSLLTMQTVLSGGGPIDSIEGYLAGEYGVAFNVDPKTALATVTATSPDSELYAGKMRQRWMSGASTDLAPPDYTGMYLKGLTSASKMTGFAHALMMLEYDTKKFPSGVPSKNIWVLRGQRLYDPRLDSTYPGGSGPHRLGDTSTYTYSANPAVCALAWALGIFSNGKRVAGIGLEWDEIDVPAFVAHANVCDANSWKIGGVVTTYDSKWAVLQAILECGSADPVDRGAVLSVMYDAPATSLYNLTVDDIVGQVEVTNTAPYKERKNTVAVRYREENQGWEIIAGDRVSSSTYVAEDNGETRTIEVEYPMVTDAKQAHQLGAYALVNGRELLQATVVCKPHLWGLEPGECLTTTIPQLALTSKKFRIMGKSLDPESLCVTLTLRSETDAKHAFALGQTQTAPPSSTFDGYDPSNPAAPGTSAWSITGTSVANAAVANGAATPALVIEGQADDPNAASVIFECRTFDLDHTYTDDQNWTSALELPAATTNRATITGLYPETSYQAAVSYRSVRGVVSKRLILGPATVGKSIAGGVRDGGIDWQANTIINVPPALELDANGMISADYIAFGPGVVLSDIANAAAQLGEFEQQLSDAGNAAIQAGTSVLSLRTYTDGLIFDANGIAVGAAVKNEANARTAGDALIANSVTALQTRLINNVATLTGSISTVSNTVTTANTAMSQRVDAVVASVAAANSNSAAGIATLANTIATANSALSTRIDIVNATLTSNVAAINATISSVSNAQVTANAATNTRISTLDSTFTTANTATNTRVTNLTTTTATANTATNVRIDGLQSSLNTANSALDARITSVSTTLTTANSALSSRIDGLSSTVTGNYTNLDGRIISAVSTQATANGVMSTRVDGLSAALTANVVALTASINAEQTARITNTSALAGTISSLDTRFTTANSTLTAAITNEATARVNANTAISTRVDGLSTTVNGHTASISTQQTSINGLSAKYVLSVNSTYGITGYELASGAGGTYFDVFADNFRVRSSTGSTAVPFSISGTQINLTGNVRLSGDLVITGTIRTATLEEYAVTRAISGSYQVGGVGTTLPSTSITTLHSLVLPTTGAAVAIMAQMSFLAGTSPDVDSQYSLTLTVKRNGTTIFTQNRVGGRGGGQVVIMTDDTPGAGNNTYTLEAIHDGSYGIGYTSTYMGLRETKR
jgi:hypothetical protein